MSNFKSIEAFRSVHGPGYGDQLFEMYKADSPIELNDAGNYLAHASKMIWANLNMESNLIGSLTKVDGSTMQAKDKFRVITGRPSTLVSPVTAGGAPPDMQKHTYAFVHVTPKWMASNFGTDQVALAASGRGQAIGWEDQVALWAREHVVGLNQSLFTHNGLATYDATNAPARIDTICASYSELNSCTDADGNAYAAGEFDLYNGTIDRDTAASWQDATVLHNSAVDRDFSLGLLRDLETAVAKNSGRIRTPDHVWLTGYDGQQLIGEHTQTFQRFMGVDFQAITGPGGVSTQSGRSIGWQVNKFDEMPIIASQHCPADTTDRWYLMDRRYVFMNMQDPTQYVESGIRQKQQLLINAFQQEGMYHTAFETVCTFFGAQGKLRDLQ
jgi:hypothetical protein